MTIEYRIRPVTRYVITRHEATENSGSTRQIGGEYDNGDVAYEVGYALAKQEWDRLDRMAKVIFPTHPLQQSGIAGGNGSDLGVGSKLGISP